MKKKIDILKCTACNRKMKEIKPWLYSCMSCGFCASNLTAGEGRGIEGLETLRRRNFTKLCNRLSKNYILTGKRLLEVGCAEGWFLEEAKNRGMIVSGIEPSIPHAEISRNKGFEVITDFFPEDIYKFGEFDFIVFNDVFEHLPDPKAAIKRCEELLAPGGVLVINLPSNHGFFYLLASLLARIGRNTLQERLWQKGFPSPHLSYFNPIALIRFIDRHTRFRHKDTFSLDTLDSDGLEVRIKASHGGIVGWSIYLGLKLLLPVIQLLPADIIAAVFEKPSETNKQIFHKEILQLKI